MGELYNAVEIIGNIQLSLLVISCLLCFFFFDKLKQPLKIFSYYLLFILIINFVAGKMSDNNINNMPLLHILIFGEFIFLSLFYKSILWKERKLITEKHFKLYLGLIGGGLILNTLWIEPLTEFNTNGKTIVQLIIMLYAILFFFQRISVLMKVDKTEQSLRLINSALLIYYSGSFLVFLSYNFMQQNKQFYSTKILIFNASLYLLFTVFIVIGFVLVIFHRSKPET